MKRVGRFCTLPSVTALNPNNLLTRTHPSNTITIERKSAETKRKSIVRRRMYGTGYCGAV